MSALKKAAAAQLPLGGFGAGNVVQLDGGKRVRLDDKVDFWPATGEWIAVPDGSGVEKASGRGMASMLEHLTRERARAGHAVEKPVPLHSDLRVPCDHCEYPAELHLGPAVYPDRKDLADRKFWVCWPCDAWVGCHTGTDQPFGPLAREELRDARRAAHAAFDPIWQDKRMSRFEAYAWLAHALDIPVEQCRIGTLTLAHCRRVGQLVWERFGVPASLR